MLRHLRRLLEERNQKVTNFKLFPPEYAILPEALLVELHNLLLDNERQAAFFRQDEDIHDDNNPRSRLWAGMRKMTRTRADMLARRLGISTLGDTERLNPLVITMH